MNNLNESIRILSDKMNMSFDKLQGILHTQMMFEMKTNIFWIVISLLIFIIGYFRIVKNYTILKQYEQYKDQYKEFWFIGAWGLAIFIFAIASACGIYDLIQMKVNPEYYMIHLLLTK